MVSFPFFTLPSSKQKQSSELLKSGTLEELYSWVEFHQPGMCLRCVPAHFKVLVWYRDTVIPRKADAKGSYLHRCHMFAWHHQPHGGVESGVIPRTSLPQVPNLRSACLFSNGHASLCFIPFPPLFSNFQPSLPFPLLVLVQALKALRCFNLFVILLMDK